MLYMLDTNILVYAMRHPTSPIHATLARYHIDELCVSMITMAELYHGAQKSKSPEQNIAMIRRIEDSIDLRPFDEPAAYQSGIVNACLERAGTPIGRADSFIAGHAISIGATLVTNNTREFLRVPHLLVEDWLIR